VTNCSNCHSPESTAPHLRTRCEYQNLAISIRLFIFKNLCASPIVLVRPRPHPFINASRHRHWVFAIPRILRSIVRKHPGRLSLLCKVVVQHAQSIPSGTCPGGTTDPTNLAPFAGPLPGLGASHQVGNSTFRFIRSHRIPQRNRQGVLSLRLGGKKIPSCLAHANCLDERMIWMSMAASSTETRRSGRGIPART
jgi:hypothetical protein